MMVYTAAEQRADDKTSLFPPKNKKNVVHGKTRMKDADLACEIIFRRCVNSRACVCPLLARRKINLFAPSAVRLRCVFVPKLLLIHPTTTTTIAMINTINTAATTTTSTCLSDVC